ncbi:hypothetical protein PP633_06105 [Mycobacteroides abscessus]|uniref:hypothetical protein n=1 Tax=Mycobacteroides abscessus TaxID=36809 RepID=UPI0005E3A77D|nr:hypothetical protein [Mycobacteroides abscessus]MDM2642465.1 hypothetical protein [Mycobacteroides abscessus]MDM2652266.1 hypothetical protein [Mycobacteroides abscessus]MDM2662827.1 hypothetical protein [Mycobacteroides abscessus]MDM2667935.1 hypothetical protein [Mycobacteroides abscessus]MDM2673361.1 hypothetical protein [Mycobacteroides abscessus]
MTRAAVIVGWVSGVVAWIALVLFWKSLFAFAALLCAAAVLVWGFQIYPEPESGRGER